MLELGFHTVHFSPMFGATVPLMEVIHATAAAGFTTLGVDLASLEAHGSLASVASALTDNGLRCSDVLVLVADADDALQTARRLASIAEVLAAPLCLAAVAAPVPTERLIATLSACADVLGDHGCRLAIEFVPYGGLGSIDRAIELADAVGWERAGLVIDSLHFFRSGAPWETLATLGAEQIAAVQWSDAPAPMPADLPHESRRQRLLPGDGGLDLSTLASAVRSTGWHGVVSAEVLSDRLRAEPPLEVAAAVHAAMSDSFTGLS